MRRVRTVEEIVFEKADPPVTLQKGSVYMVYEVVDGGIVLLAEDGELIAIDQNTFEAGFEAMAGDA